MVRILTRQSNGVVEYHIPDRYDERRPGFTFTVTKYDISLEDHHLAGQLPRATAKPSVQGSQEEVMRSLCLHPEHPRTLDDWLYSDRPLLDIHVVAFEDATLVTITFMHLVTGASGMRQILRAWSDVLNGREEEVGALEGIGDDLLTDHIYESEPNEYVHYDKRLTRLKKLVFLIYAFWDWFWFPAAESRLICIPGVYVDRMRDQAIQDLSHGAVPGQESPFISDGDVLLAWATRTVVKALGASPSRPLTVLNVFNSRATLLRKSASDSTAFITNACLMWPTFLSVGDATNLSLGHLAWQFRTSLTQQRTKAQCQAQLAMKRQGLIETGSAPFCVDPTSVLVGCTNWHRARFYDIDFSSAVRCPQSHQTVGSSRIGRPASILVSRDLTGPGIPNLGNVFGKDGDGNWWLTWSLSNQAWPAFQQELETLGTENEGR